MARSKFKIIHDTYYNRLIILRVSWQRQANNEDVDEVALWASVRLAMERSEYYNEDKKTADAVCRAVKPKSTKSKKAEPFSWGLVGLLYSFHTMKKQSFKVLMTSHLFQFPTLDQFSLSPPEAVLLTPGTMLEWGHIGWAVAAVGCYVLTWLEMVLVGWALWVFSYFSFKFDVRDWNDIYADFGPQTLNIPALEPQPNLFLGFPFTSALDKSHLWAEVSYHWSWGRVLQANLDCTNTRAFAPKSGPMLKKSMTAK